MCTGDYARLPDRFSEGRNKASDVVSGGRNMAPIKICRGTTGISVISSGSFVFSICFYVICPTNGKNIAQNIRLSTITYRKEIDVA